MMASRVAGSIVAGCLFGLAAAVTHAAEPCREAADPQDAGVMILHCGSVLIAAEATAVRSPASSMSSHQGAIQIDSGAMAVSANSSTAQFSALTPDAVISGRDGEWIIIAEAGRTHVAVRRGTVVSRLRTDGSQKVMQAGDAELNATDSPRSERLAEALRRARDPK